MKKPGYILLLTGLAFLGFAAYGLLHPLLRSWPASIFLPVPAGSGEMRAYYGDFELGFGLFLLLASFHPRLREAAHLAAALTLGLIALGRGWWMLRAGSGNAILAASALAELTFTAANLWAFYRLKSLARSAAER